MERSMRGKVRGYCSRSEFLAYIMRLIINLVNEKCLFFLGVALLPFVDEKRLHRALNKVYDDLTEDEGMSKSKTPLLIYMDLHLVITFPFVYIF